MVATSLTAIGAAVIMGLQFARAGWAYVALPARTAAVVTTHAQDIAEPKLWKRKKDRRDWKTGWCHPPRQSAS